MHAAGRTHLRRDIADKYERRGGGRGEGDTGGVDLGGLSNFVDMYRDCKVLTVGDGDLSFLSCLSSVY